ncbi:hypothetical protein Esti_002885 [Eimeria stiedai]
MRLWWHDVAAAAAAAIAAAAATTAPLLAWADPGPAEQQQQQQQQGLPVWASKLLATSILVLVSAGGAALPVYLQRRAAAEETPEQEAGPPSRRTRNQSWMQVVLVSLNCFACGAFLGLGLLHLLPEAAQQLEDSGVSVQLRDADHYHSYNSAYVLAAAGLTFMLFVDQLWGHAHAHGHSHGDSGSDSESVGAAADSAAAAAAAAALPHPAHLHAQQHGSCSEAAYCPECDDCVEANTAANEQDLGCSQRPAAAAARAANDGGGLQQQQDTAASGRAAHAAAAAVAGAAAARKFSVVVPAPSTHDARRSSSSSSGSKNSRMLPCTSTQCACAAAAAAANCHNSCCGKGDSCVGGALQGCCARSHSPDSELRVHCGLTGDKCQVSLLLLLLLYAAASPLARLDSRGCFSDEAYLLLKLQQQQQSARMPGGGAAAKGSSKVPLAIALGTHALLEAMVVGATRSGADVWLSTLAILGHKGAEAVALASALLKAGGSVCCNLVCCAAFVAATPIGVLVGSFVAQGGQAAAGVLNALAVGIILYACIEMLAEFSVKASLPRRLLRCFAFLCGLGLLFGLDLLHAPVCRARHHHGHALYCDHQSPAAAPAAVASVSSHNRAAETHSHSHLHQHGHLHSNRSASVPSAAAAAAAPAAGVSGSILRGSSPSETSFPLGREPRGSVLVSKQLLQLRLLQ